MPSPEGSPGLEQPLQLAQSTMSEQMRWHAATRELVGGVIAGAVNVTSGYPFDTMKVRLQAGKGAYEGMTDCFLHIWKTEGAHGFFRGLSSPLIGGAAETGVNYLVYSRVLDLFKPKQQQQTQSLQTQSLQQTNQSPAALHQKKQQPFPQNTQLLPAIAEQVVQQQHALYQQQLHQQQHSSSSSTSSSTSRSSSSTLPPLTAVPVAGAIAGVALSVILSPTELIKCRMQMAQFNSPIRCLVNVLETEGLRGLSRGFVPTLCREIPGNAIFFTVYEGLRRSWPGRPVLHHGSSSSSDSRESEQAYSEAANNSSSSSSSSSRLAQLRQIAVDASGAVVCGGIAGVVMWTSVLPLDVAKTRIQTAQPGSSWDTSVPKQLVMLWREGGRRSLWAGLAPTIARAFPANACQWLAWELAMRQLLPPAYEAGNDGSVVDGSREVLHAQQAAVL